MNNRFAWATGLVSATLLAGSALAQTGRVTVQVGVPTPNVAALQLYVAQQAGFFTEEGLEVEVRYSSGAPQALQLVAAGQADVAMGTLEPLVSGQEAGLRAKAFARVNRQLIYYIAVPEESSYRKVEDLRDAKLGVANLGGAAASVARSILRASKVDPAPDMLLPVGFGAQAVAALKSNRVQALGMWSNAYYAMERSGVRLRYFRHPTLSEFGNSALMASDRTLETRQKDLCGFGRAIAKASAFMAQNPNASLHMYWTAVPGAREGKGEAEDLRTGMVELSQQVRDYDIGFPPAARYGAFDETTVASYVALLEEQGLAKTRPPVQAIVTNALVGCINAFDAAQVRERARAWKR